MNYKLLVALLRNARYYGKLKSKDYNLNSTESIICSYLYNKEPQTQDCIAREHLMDKTTVAKSLSNLMKKGYIIKAVNLENRRENLISLTEKGEVDIQKIVDEQSLWLKRVSEGLDASEVEIFNRVLEKMLDNAEGLLEEYKDGSR